MSPRTLLGLGLWVQCAAAAWLLHDAPGHLNGALFLELGWPEARANALDRLAWIALPILASLALRRPRAWNLLPIALWFAADAWAVVAMKGSPYAPLAPWGSALRYGTPLALLALQLGHERAARLALGTAIAAVFASHGWKAWLEAPEFQNLIWGVWQRWLPFGAPSPHNVENLLAVIAVQDALLALGALLLGFGLRPLLNRRGFLLYMALWGVLTAASRPLALGWNFSDLCLLRALNALGPYALWRLTRP